MNNIEFDFKVALLLNRYQNMKGTVHKKVHDGVIYTGAPPASAGIYIFGSMDSQKIKFGSTRNLKSRFQVHKSVQTCCWDDLVFHSISLEDHLYWEKWILSDLKCLNAYVHGEMFLMSTLDMVNRVINLLIRGKPPSILCVKRFISPNFNMWLNGVKVNYHLYCRNNQILLYLFNDSIHPGFKVGRTIASFSIWSRVNSSNLSGIGNLYLFHMRFEDAVATIERWEKEGRFVKGLLFVDNVDGLDKDLGPLIIRSDIRGTA